MSDERVSRGTGQVVVTGTAVLSAYGPGTETLLSGVLSGRPAFAPVQRFDVSLRRVGSAAATAGSPQLDGEVARAVREACGLRMFSIKRSSSVCWGSMNVP